ncbi:TIGR02281 family clan AA aspartic protease [Ramlibacter sp. G-1-2-2]|uniref:TIGR02281 family clan AA aspartic protease n=1 Tax=Ramlibacter agri TaxID=2728837 RepID=A0A848HAT5_9BURK|nr:retropepsin-like aspartic protease [Ramlibacter agri]NML44718.1 TIGR02281 family clan AA aspartic protease [Ramlibacter agri]
MQRLAALLLALAAFGAAAQSVTLQGMLGTKALLMIDGAPKTVAPGDSVQGVKVLSTSGDQAVVEIGGKRQTLHVGDAPASMGSTESPRGNRIVLPVGSGGHFFASGSINGKPVEFLVDTGATSVAMSVGDAQRLGLDYQSGRPIGVNTANGVVPAWLLRLGSVRIGDVEVYDVDAVVSPASMPYVLLGNSFLNRFQMTRQNDQMVLERRY